MLVNVYNYDNKKKAIEVNEDFNLVLVEIYAGDEVIEFYNDRELVYKVDAADLFGGKRDASFGEFFDGRYVVTDPDIEEWAKFTYHPRHYYETISYKRQNKFFSLEQFHRLRK